MQRLRISKNAENEEMQKTDYGKAFKIINLFEEI